MDFGFNPEQEQLRDQVRRFLDGECPLTRVREIMEDQASHDAALWSKMAELGWQALTIPEAYDGIGLCWEDLVVVAEEMGKSLFPSPFLTNAAAARAIERIGNERQKTSWLPGMAAGELIATCAILEESDDFSDAGVQAEAELADALIILNGKKMFVPYGQAADLLLVAAREAGGVSLFAVPSDAPGVTVVPLLLSDPAMRAAEVVLESVTVGPEDRLGEAGAVWPELMRVVDAATVALSAEMVGAADAACRLATEYAKVRKQFGQPIGRFQGVKHRLAEIYVGIESARSLVYYASWAVDNVEDPAGHVSMAKAYASTALDEAGEDGVQIHGGIGYTWECDAQLYHKRGRYCRNLLGSPEHHRERLLACQGL